MPLFEYAILHKPTRTKAEVEAGAAQREDLVCGPETIVARTKEEASIVAARNIPDEHMDHLSEIEVVVRPF